jgi:hypothetical protein
VTDIPEENRESDLKIAAVVVVITLLLAGTPMFLYMAMDQEDTPESVTIEFYDALSSGDYGNFIDRSLFYFDDDIDLRESIENSETDINIITINRIYESDGVNIDAIEARMKILENDYGVIIDGWSALKMKAILSFPQSESQIDVVYSLQFEIEGKWYVDAINTVDRPSEWNVWLLRANFVYGTLDGLPIISEQEIKIEFIRFDEPGNITDVRIEIVRVDEPMNNDTVFAFSGYTNGTRSYAFDWISPIGERLKMQPDALTWVDADNDGALTNGDYLLIHLDEYVIGAIYNIKMYVSTIFTSGLEFTLQDL